LTTKTAQMTYFNLDSLREKEDPKFYELQKLLIYRMDLAETAAQAEKERKEVDEQLRAFIDSWGVEGLILDDIIANIQNGRAAGKWNKERLTMVLTPEQMEKVYTTGKEFSFVKVERNAKRVKQAIEG
jgi:hypothetical protein